MVRVGVILPSTVRTKLKAYAKTRHRSLSALCADWVERGFIEDTAEETVDDFDESETRRAS